MKLLNMSHPLTPAARKRLEEMLEMEVDEVVMEVQLNLDAPLTPQLDALVDQTAKVWFDLFIPPSFAVAAAYMGAKLAYAQADAMRPIPPAMVVLRREALAGFMPVEVVYG